MTEIRAGLCLLSEGEQLRADLEEIYDARNVATHNKAIHVPITAELETLSQHLAPVFGMVNPDFHARFRTAYTEFAQENFEEVRLLTATQARKACDLVDRLVRRLCDETGDKVPPWLEERWPVM